MKKQKEIRVDVSNSYITVALTGKEKDIKKVVGKAIAEEMGFDGQALNVSLHYGYEDEEGLFQTKPLTELFKDGK